MRKATIERRTNETDIQLTLNLDGNQNISVNTKVPFFDHMLTLFAFHGKFDLNITCDGDIEVDDHHTVEDVGLVLGAALYKALGDKVGIYRYGASLLPMDESLARVVIDINNRPVLVYRNPLTRERLGTMDTQNVQEFFKSVVTASKITLHAEVLYGDNEHHRVEALFKAFGKALRQATHVEGDIVMSTKGVL